MNQRGLTLLELLLVLVILSSLALASASFLGNADGQARFEDTRRKLNSLRTAIVGSTFDPQVNNLSGFVVDMGVLPESIDQLINGQKYFADVSGGFPKPLFDRKRNPEPHFIDGGSSMVDELDVLLVKGYRGGYLLTGPTLAGADAEFRDGFGNRTAVPDDGNFGWVFDALPAGNPTSLTISSRGELEGDYSNDVFIEVARHHWAVDPVPLKVKVLNRGPSLAGLRNEDELLVVLIVFKGGSAHRWLQLQSDTSDSEKFKQDSSACFEIPIPAGAHSVSMGQHLLVLVHTTDQSNVLSKDFGDTRYTQRMTLRPGPHPTSPIQFLIN